MQTDSGTGAQFAATLEMRDLAAIPLEVTHKVKSLRKALVPVLRLWQDASSRC